MKLLIRRATREKTGTAERIAFLVSGWYATQLHAIFQKAPDMLFDITIEPHRRKRSTGYKSQSHHANGHIQQIAAYTGDDFDSVKIALKHEAIAAGYPFDTIMGRVIPWSETRIDTAQCAILIETCHRIAAELGISLKED
jgi:hypothetical protein